MSAPPPCVSRYLERAGRVARGMRLAQEGRLRTSPSSRRWMPFAASHEALVDRPEFTWKARVWAASLVTIEVEDRLRAGAGSGEVRLWGMRLGQDAGTPEMHSGALHRYLAEAVWIPGALAPREGLRWSPIDERRALATLSDPGREVSLEFRFDEAGDVAAVFTPARWGKFGRGYQQRAWEGHFRDWVDRDGLRLPLQGEVGWYEGAELRLVWQGRIRGIAPLP